MSKKKTGLGRGIGALLDNIDVDLDPTASGLQAEEKVQILKGTAEIPIESIELNPFQPRRDFDEEKLKELSQSISNHGVVQPITVRLKEGTTDRFQLISGERRLRASTMAGKTEIPAYIRLADDQAMLEMAIIENIQRENLNPIEVGMSYQRLLEEVNLTHEQLAQRVGKNRSSVTNYLRLLKLPPEIQKGLQNGKISMGHARAILGTDDIATQLLVYGETLEKALSVRAVEQLVRQYASFTRSTGSKKVAAINQEIKRVQDDLCKRYDRKINIKHKSNGSGQIVFNFNSKDDLNDLLDTLDG